MDFTQEEWEKCIKVLKILAKDPDKGLDINVLKGLVTKIHKQAKKQNKAKVQAEILASVEIPQAFLSLQKAQKVITHQDIYKQYDIFLKSNTLLFQNYEGILQQKEAEMEEKEFIYPQKCYQCRQPYKQLHFFYHSMCVECGTFNYEKRSQKANLQEQNCAYYRCEGKNWLFNGFANVERWRKSLGYYSFCEGLCETF